MKRELLTLVALIVCLVGGAALADGDDARAPREFSPKVDGWYFHNWGETDDLSWDLYREAYLGISPVRDSVLAPLDSIYYDIIKGVAKPGNCGGMSLLALALFKYGGYMGFCSPASFYAGTVGPASDDLRRAINILQAHGFSAFGIENFIDHLKPQVSEVFNAHRAFQEVKENLAKGDYPLLMLATDLFGSHAHVVIPYRVEENPPWSPGTKVIHIWDPNNPYDDDPARYEDDNPAHCLIIRDPFNWTYTSDSGDRARTYSCSSADGRAWCFCAPMSKILPKGRQPLAALDLVCELPGYLRDVLDLARLAVDAVLPGLIDSITVQCP